MMTVTTELVLREMQIAALTGVLSAVASWFDEAGDDKNAAFIRKMIEQEGTPALEQRRTQEVGHA